jgi:hypothetical protein
MVSSTFLPVSVPCLLVCISEADLEPVSGSVRALLFSQCSMVQSSSVWVGVWGVRVLLLLGFFFLLSVATVSQQHFLFTELMLSASSLWLSSWVLLQMVDFKFNFPMLLHRNKIDVINLSCTMHLWNINIYMYVYTYIWNIYI